MNRYRMAFFVTLTAAVLLAVAFVYVWRHPHVPVPHNTNATGEASKNPQPSSSTAPSPAGTEPDLAPVSLTAQRMQSIGVKTGVVEYKSVHDEIRTTGNVEADESRLAEVQVRFSGWIQTVYADATFQRVRKGQRLLTIYSPDLVTTENEYLIAKQNSDTLARSSVPGVASGATSLLSSTLERLKQWGVPERELEELERSGKVKREIEIDAPVSGSIVERNALPNMYVQPGTKLYSLADLSTVWVYAQAFQSDLGRLKVGTPAHITVDAYPGRIFRGRVSFIWPQLDPTTRTAKLRIEIPNPDLSLSLGMFVNAELEVPLGRQLVVPASAVFRTGTRQIAFLEFGEGHFEPRDLALGARAGDDVVVSSGLNAGDHVVTSANFLIDSESQLQAALGSFAPPPPGVSTAAEGSSSATKGPQGQASIEYTSIPATPHKGSNTFRVKLTAPNGSPIPGAQVTVTFFMPAMPAMGMAAMRTVTTLNDKGAGLYEGVGQVQMGGAWQVTVLATQNGQTIAQKQMSVIAEGGMQ
jgi:multidrug efflux pump subunit AcrA (membrane-fusion protein)/nitrogen fixation protein FixH